MSEIVAEYNIRWLQHSYSFTDDGWMIALGPVPIGPEPETVDDPDAWGIDVMLSDGSRYVAALVAGHPWDTLPADTVNLYWERLTYPLRSAGVPPDTIHVAFYEIVELRNEELMRTITGGTR